MKKTVRLLCMVAVGWFMHAPASYAIDLPWSTTFNCPDWVQDGNPLPSCDGVYLGNQIYYCSGAGDTRSRVTSAGNNPHGVGGKGFRIAMGDGTSNLGAKPQVSLNTPQPELWIRFYVRWPSGFSWGPMQFQKMVYLNTTASLNAAIVDLHPHDFSLYKQTGGGIGWHYNDHHTCDQGSQHPNYGWNDVMGGSAGDGQWHYYEIHVKTDTNGTNGIFEAWIDGVLRNSHHDVNWDRGRFTNVAFMTNQISPANGECVYVDWDDIAISTGGYIGPANGGSGGGLQAKPKPPMNLR